MQLQLTAAISCETQLGYRFPPPEAFLNRDEPGGFESAEMSREISIGQPREHPQTHEIAARFDRKGRQNPQPPWACDHAVHFGGAKRHTPIIGPEPIIA